MATESQGPRPRDTKPRRKRGSVSESVLRQVPALDRARLVGRLASSMAHDVKNPLLVILMGVGFLEKKLADRDPEVDDLLRHMESAVRRANQTLQEFHEFARTQGEMRRAWTVDTILERCLVLVRQEFVRRGVRLTTRVEKGLPLLWVNRGDAEQAIIGLALNALDATAGRPGAAVRVAARRGRGGLVLIEVIDNGPGLVASDRARLYSPFSTRERLTAASGLGLAAARSIMARSGGRIRVRNRVARPGVRAVLGLPAAPVADAVGQPDMPGNLRGPLGPGRAS